MLIFKINLFYHYLTVAKNFTHEIDTNFKFCSTTFTFQLLLAIIPALKQKTYKFLQ